MIVNDEKHMSDVEYWRSECIYWRKQYLDLLKAQCDLLRKYKESVTLKLK